MLLYSIVTVGGVLTVQKQKGASVSKAFRGDHQYFMVSVEGSRVVFLAQQSIRGADLREEVWWIGRIKSSSQKKCSDRLRTVYVLYSYVQVRNISGVTSTRWGGGTRTRS